MTLRKCYWRPADRWARFAPGPQDESRNSASKGSDAGTGTDADEEASDDDGVSSGSINTFKHGQCASGGRRTDFVTKELPGPRLSDRTICSAPASGGHAQMSHSATQCCAQKAESAVDIQEVPRRASTF